MEQEIKELKQLEKKDIKKIQQESINIMEQRIKQLYKEWSSEMEKKDKQITELMMEKLTITQKMNELKSAHTELLKQYNDIKEKYTIAYNCWKERKQLCEQYQEQIEKCNNQKKMIPKHMNINNSKSTKTLPHINIYNKLNS